MQTQESNPDEFEQDLISIFQSFDRVPLGEWSNKRWTSEVKYAVKRVAEKRGYSVYASGIDLAKGGEWLYDLTCLEEEGV